MPQRQWSSAAHRSSTPDVARPGTDIWQKLESERISWEGQVLIVGQEADLPALLVITDKRLALIANNEIALEFPVAWMRPEPKLTAENGIRLFISPNDDSQITQPMLLRTRTGRAAAAEIAAVLTGRIFGSRESDSPMHIPAWNERAGAARSVALPQLSDDATSRNPMQKTAWPPAETTGVRSSARPADQSATPRPSAGVVPWRAGSSMADPQPVPTDASRAARLLGTSGDGYTISDQPKDSSGSRIEPAQERKHRMPMWLLNIGIVALLLSGFSYVAYERGYSFDNLRSIVPGNIAPYVGLETPTEESDVALAPDQDIPGVSETTIAQGGDNRLLPVTNTSVQPTQPVEEPVLIGADDMDGIGGSTGRLPVTASVVGTPDDADVDTDTPSEEAVDDSTEDVPEPATEIATEPATEEPTEIVTEEIVETPAATEAATGTVEPTEQPMIDPTIPQETETPAPTVDPTQTVTLEQPASVADGSVPNQEFQQDGIRYSINAAATGSGIADLPEINNIGQTWVIVTLTGANTSENDQSFSLSNFTLLADGNTIPLDTGTGWVNGLLGNDPAYGNVDSATWALGEQHQFTLTFLAPANVSSLVLITGDQQIALDPAITSSVGLREVARDEAPAAVLTGTVVDVVDGQTIVVDVDGEQITVRYLGIDAPTGEACYASESTTANAALVEGETVTLERQSVDTTARGLWVRDVWVTDAEGNQVLVSQALIAEGMATSKVSDPNSRYAGWLTSTEQNAETNDIGLWSTCGGN